jgi:hypothetical protein
MSYVLVVTCIPHWVIQTVNTNSKQRLMQTLVFAGS